MPDGTREMREWIRGQSHLASNLDCALLKSTIDRKQSLFDVSSCNWAATMMLVVEGCEYEMCMVYFRFSCGVAKKVAVQSNIPGLCERQVADKIYLSVGNVHILRLVDEIDDTFASRLKLSSLVGEAVV